MLVSPRPAAEQLRVALAELLDDLPPRPASVAVERLIEHYRGRTPTDAPVLRDRFDAAAYAAYRMPATFAATVAALTALAERMPRWAPASHLDAGGGTGAAVWAASAVWTDPAAPRETTVLDWAASAVALGRELAGSGPAVLRETRWRRQRIARGLELPASDLVTVGYVLGELTDADRRAVLDAVARAGQVVVLVEPGTPAGYARIREARDRLTAAGLRVLAPCPHSAVCPVRPGADWCHFSVRVNRSSLHRRVKGGTLPYEDEKFSYLAAVRSSAAEPAAARVVRRPQLRKGQVLLELCHGDGDLRRATVTKRTGGSYRAAREIDWGDVWPPSTPG